MTDTRDDAGLIAFGERVLSLLDEARYSTTYKHALLLSLIDNLRVQADSTGAPPRALAVSALAETITEMYWHQTFPFAGPDGPVHLRQSRTGDARVISLIVDYRTREGLGPRDSFHAALNGPRAAELIDEVEWTVAAMPLPRLQRPYGDFMYSLDWDQDVTRRSYRESSREVRFRHGAEHHLTALAGLIRPVVERRWALLVAAMNRHVVDDARLDSFLFAPARRPPRRLIADLADLQGGTCFYCASVPSAVHVDHFLPWSQTGDDSLDNLVIACAACNGDKAALLAAGDHVEAWAARSAPGSRSADDLDLIASDRQWPRRTTHTWGWARSLYLAAPSDRPTWPGFGKRATVGDDITQLRVILGQAEVTLADVGR